MNGSSQQEVFRPGFIPGRSSADDLMDKAQKAMVAIAEFMKEVRERQQTRELKRQVKVSPIQPPVAPPRKASAINQQLSRDRQAHGEPPTCPECNDVMVLRTSAYGDFWGCSNYPTCQAKRGMDGHAMVPKARTP